MKPRVLITNLVIPPEYLDIYGKTFTVHYTPTAEDRKKALSSNWLPDVRGVVTSGSNGLQPEFLDAMQKLEIVCVKGAGYDKLDLGAMERRGLPVTHSPGVNAPSVAEHAIGMMLAAMRRIPQADAAVRRGEWMSARTLRPTMTGKRLGILGLGRIGMEIAERAHGGFRMPVAYHSRNPRQDVSYRYCASPVALAAESDFFIVACPGGDATHHLVNAEVIAAMGPKTYVINVARGSIVDTPALIAALAAGRIAGAGLDVVEGEPAVPEALLALPNVVITPHLGGRSEDAANDTLDLVLENLKAHFSGKPVLTPIPESKKWRRAAPAPAA